MTISPPSWALIFLAQLFLISLALGSVALSLPRWLPVPGWSRFLIGFCLAPYAVSLWMLLVSATLPGAPRWVFVLPPDLIAMGLLVIWGPRTLRHLLRLALRGYRAGPLSLIVTAVVGLAIVSSALLPKLVQNGRAIVIGHDAVHFLGISLKFAQERSYTAIADWRGRPDGGTIGEVHGPVFPAYLGYALLNTSDGERPGYPNDHAARAAFQVTTIYTLLATAALAGVVRVPGSGAFALILLLQVPVFEYISYQASRDPFRTIASLLLVTGLCRLTPRRLRRRLPPGTWILLAILATYCLGGHTLSVLLVPLIGFAWFVWAIAGRARWVNIVLVLLALGVGMLLGGLRYIDSYLETGDLRGQTDFLYALEGTPLWDVLHEYNLQRQRSDVTNLQRLTMLLGWDRYRLSVAGAGTALLVSLVGLLRPRQRNHPLTFIGLAVLAMFIPASGLADTSIYQFSLAYTANERYFLDFYALAAACVTSGLSLALRRLTVHRSQLVRVSAVAAWWLVIGLVTYSSYTTISADTWRVSHKDEAWLDDWIKTVRMAAEHAPVGKRLLMDNTALNYYLDNQAMILYIKPTWDIIQARDEEQARQALDELNIGGVILLDRSIPGFWDQAPFFSFYTNPQNAILFARENGYTTYLLIGPPYSMSSEVSFNFIDHLDVATKVSLDNDTYIGRSAFAIDLVPKRVLYAHPPAQLSFRPEIPNEARLRFFPTMAPEVWKLGRGDGVQFDVYVDDGDAVHQVFSGYFDPKNISDQRRWIEQSVDLSRWGGRTVTVTLATGSGPNNDDRYDWAGWGEPRIVRPVAYDFLEQRK